MRTKLDLIVRVYVGGTVDIPSIGLSGGVCTWSSADQSQSILSESYISNVSDSVDISASGNYTRYSDCSVYINKSSIVETTLRNYDLTLKGKRIECVQSDGVNEDIIRRGVVRSTSEVGNSFQIVVAHLANYYNTSMTPRIGKENQNIVFGSSVDGVELAYIGNDGEEIAIGDGLMPVFEVLENRISEISLRCVYDETIVGLTDLSDFLDGSKHFKAEGQNSLITDASSYSIGFDIIGSKTYLKVLLNLVPFNRRDENGDDYLPVGENVILKSTGYDSYLYPTGSDIDPTKISYESGGNTFPLPHYVDSRIDYNNRTEILDSDNIGDYNVAQSNARFGLSVPDDNIPVVSQSDFYDRGFYFKPSANSTAYVEGYSITNEEFIDSLSNTTQSASLRVDFNTLDALSSPQQCTFSFVNTTTVDPKTVDSDKLYYTAFNLIENNVRTDLVIDESWSFHYRVYVTTLRATYSVLSKTTTGELLRGSSYSPIENSMPQTATSNSSNVEYRWENTTLFDTDELGNQIDIYGVIQDEWEKQLPITITTVVTYNGAVVYRDEGNYVKVSTRVNIASPVEYDAGNLIVEGVAGRLSSDDTAITNTSDAYLNTLRLQNYQYYGIDTPDGGWGLDYPVMDYGIVIDPTILPRSYDLSYTTSNTSTNAVKYDMLKYTCGIGYINSDGLEDWADVTGMYSSGAVQFNKRSIKGMPNVGELDATRVYPEISIEYSGGTININNTDQEFFNSSYVTGVDDVEVAESLWSCGRLLYKEFGIKNEYPKKLSDVSGIKTQADAIDHIKNQYKIMGAVTSGREAVLYKRYRASFSTGIEKLFNTGITVGTVINFSYPNIASDNSGIITSTNKDHINGTVTINGEFVGDIISSSASSDIEETGTQDDSIEETATQDTNYVEGV